ncbi:c-type heme family protein [Ramlibacter rhizophilus]|nr:DUF3365 domain-containing protein [Ramlibacter rhizophilus]
MGVGLLAGLAATLLLCEHELEQNARRDVIRQARLVLDAAETARRDTMDQHQSRSLVMPTPLLPPSEPSFAAYEAVERVRRRHAEFHYTEAVANPVQPGGPDADWEHALIDRFRLQAQLHELVTEAAGGTLLVLARAVRTGGAFQSDGAADGTTRGAGELASVQIVSVPAIVAARQADAVFWPLALKLAGLFIAVFVVLERLYACFVGRPLRELAEISTRVSLGDFDQPEFSDASADDIALLGHAFNRMRRSVTLALRLLTPEPSA